MFVKDAFEATEMVGFKGGLKEFHSTYGDHCLNVLNSHRNYIVDQVRNVSWDYLSDHDGTLPSIDQMEMFAKRGFVWADATAPTRRLFTWYVRTLMKKAAGTEDWKSQECTSNTCR